jgi:NADPH:quinone reductase-like Zn-dependent oxidoreductase
VHAVRIHRHGGPDVLVYEEAPEPSIGPTDVLVRVRATSVNHIDIWVRGGLPRLRLQFPHILGADAAGVVEAVGAGVRDLEVGAEVMLAPGVSCGQCAPCAAGDDTFCPAYSILGEHIDGGYAERVAVPRANAVAKPPHLSFEEAAAVPLVFVTAWNMLVTHGRIRRGETVLVWGGGSGVGSAAIQIARLHGARVIATAGAAWKLDRARALGADEVINHADQDVFDEVRRMTSRRGVDIVFEHIGAATWDASVRLLARGGRLVTCGATTGAEARTDIRYIFGRELSICGTWLGPKRDFYAVMVPLSQGLLRPVVDRVLPLAQAAEAHAIMQRREHFGKIVLVP